MFKHRGTSCRGKHCLDNLSKICEEEVKFLIVPNRRDGNPD